MASKQIEFDAVVSANQINKLLADLRSGAEGAATAINNALGGTVTKKIVFEEVIGANGVKQLIATEKQRLTVADQIINRQSTLDKVQRGSLTSLRQQVNSLTQARDGIQRYQKASTGVFSSIKNQNSEWTKVNAQLSSVSRELAIAGASGFWSEIKAATNTQGLINIGNGLTNITQGLQAASILVGQFFGAINQVIDTAAQLQSFGLSFQAIGAGAAGAMMSLQEISKIALGLGVDINTVQEGFKQLSPVVLNSGGTLGDVSGIVESLSSRFAAFGISGDKARRVMMGVIQAFAKGKLQAEELTQQISEADPAFKTDFAKALFKAKDSLGTLGKEVTGTTANLEKLVKQGKITADVLIKILPGLSKSGLLFGKLGDSGASAVAALEKGSVTIDQVRNNFKNLNQLSLRNLAESAKPLINAFLSVQAIVIDFFTRLSKSSALVAFSNIATTAVKSIGRLVDVFFMLIEGAAGIVSVFKPVIDIIANIPGVAELAGLAIIGKILGPLNLFERKVQTTKAAWSNFGDSIAGAFVAPRKEINAITGQIGKLKSTLTGVEGTVITTPEISSKNIDTKNTNNITKSVSNAISQITAIGNTSAAQVGLQIEKVQTRIARLSERLIALRSSSVDTNGSNTFSQKEIDRQAKLIASIEQSKQKLRDLESTKSAIQTQTIQTKGESVSFDPQATQSIKNATDEYRKLAEARIIASDPIINKNKERELEITKNLAQIEKERVFLASSSIAITGTTTPENYKTEETIRLKEELSNLSNERYDAIAAAKSQATAETNIGSILDDGSSKTATFAQRQRALAASTDVIGIAFKNNREEIKSTIQELRVLQEKRDELAKPRAERKDKTPFLGTGAIGGTVPDAIGKFDEGINKAKESLKELGTERKQLISGLEELRVTTDINEKTFNSFGNSAKRLGSGLGNLLLAPLRGIFGGLKSLVGGFKAVIASIDPLIIAMVLVGAATRLYSDGMKEATEVSKKYKEQTSLLNAAISDINPSKAATEQTTALGRAWQSLAIVTAKLGNSLGSAFEGIAGGLESFADKLKNTGDAITDGVANIAGSISLVAGLGTLGAAIGSLIAPVAGTIVGGLIGGIIGVIASLGLGSTDAAKKLDTLKTKLKEVDAGSGTTTSSAVELSKQLSKIGNAKGEVTLENVNKIKEGLTLLKNTAAETKKELLALQGLKGSNENDIKSNQKQIDANKKLIDSLKQKRAELENNPSLGPAATGVILGLGQEIGRLEDKNNSLTSTNQSLTASNKLLGASIGGIQKDLTAQEGAVSSTNKALTNAQTTNLSYINTLDDLDEAIKNLQGKNKGLDLSDKGDLKTLEENLNAVKKYQAILESVSKTKYEVQLEFKTIGASIAEAQTKIDIEPGVLREFVTTAREVEDSISTAGDKFKQSAGYWSEASKDGTVEAGFAKEQIKLAGYSYIESIKKGTATLVDAARDFRDKLKDAQTSLANLVISKPEFFTDSEIKASASKIREEFAAAVRKVRSDTGSEGFFPKLEGITPEDKLKSMASFTATRKEADSLVKSIGNINVSLQGITLLLAEIAGVPMQNLKKYGLDINKITEATKTNIDGITTSLGEAGKATPRIGETVGKISAGGKELILYYDNVTRSVEQVTVAEFAALQQADKLAKGGEKVGQGFENGSQKAAKGIASVNERIGQVYGEINSNGKTQILYYDNLTQQAEAVDKATFDRLSKEQEITKQNATQAKTLENVIKLNQNSNAIVGNVASSGTANVSRGVVGALSSDTANQGYTGGSTIMMPRINEEEGRRRFAAVAQSLGGDFIKILNNVIETGGEGSFPLRKLGFIQEAVTEYKLQLGLLPMVQQQAADAQNEYNKAVANGSNDTAILAANVERTQSVLASQNLELENAQENYKGAGQLARQLGVDINSVPEAGKFLPPAEEVKQSLQQWIDETNKAKSIDGQSIVEGLVPTKQELDQSLTNWNNYVNQVQTGVANLGQPEGGGTYQDPTAKIAKGSKEVLSNLGNGATAAESVANGLGDGATAAEKISSSINSWVDKTINITFKMPRPRWTGGPVDGGQSYQVNELGQEGFLDKSGNLKPINKPAYGIWRAPSSGVVVPAHIMSELNVPATGIKTSEKSGMIIPANQGGELSKIARRIEASIARNESLNNSSELAIIQSQQAIEIGNLSRAVNKLTVKKWNVNVSVNSKGSTGYLNTLNHYL